MLYRIISPCFVCGLITENGKITKAAPIIAYSYKLGLVKFLNYCKRKQWSVEEIV